MDIACLSYSRDGHWLLTGGGALILWDVRQHKAVRSFGENDEFTSECAFLGSDIFASIGQRGSLHIWDPARTNAEVGTVGVMPRGENAYSLSYRLDPLEFIVGGEYGSVYLLNEDGPRAFSNGNPARRNLIFSVGFTAAGDPYYVDEKNVLRFGNMGEDVSTDPEDPSELRRVQLRGPQDRGIFMLGAHPLAGGHMFVGDRDGSRIVDETGTVLVELAEQGPSRAAAVSRAEDKLATSTDDEVSVWSIDGKRTCSRRMAGMSFTFSPDGEQLAVGGRDGRVYIIDSRSCQVTTTLENDRSFVTAVALNSKSIAIGDQTGRVIAWDTKDLSQVSVLKAHASSVTAIALPRADTIVSGDRDGFVIKSDLKTHRTEQLTVMPNSISAMATSSETGHVLVADVVGSLARVGIQQAQTDMLFHLPSGTGIDSVSISPDGKGTLFGTRDGAAYILEGNEAQPTIWREQSGAERIAVYSEFQPIVATASDDGEIELRTPSGGSVRRLIGPQSQLAGAAFTKEYLWAAEFRGTLWRWPISQSGDGQTTVQGEAVSTPETPTDAIQAIATSEDAGIVATARLDGTLELRSVKDAAPMARLISMSDGGWAVLRPDGTFKATRSAARELVAERSSDNKSWTLADIAAGVASNEVSVGTPGVERLPDGAVSVRFTVTSPAGPPRVVLDGVWSLSTTTTSAVDRYDVAFFLRDLRGGTHRVRADGPRGATKEFNIDLPPDPTYSDLQAHHRVLAIGLNHYDDPSVDDLQSAEDDAHRVAMEFTKSYSWNLGPKSSRAEIDLTGDALKKQVREFLVGHPGETLLLFLAGHGDLQNGESVLLPKDYDPSNPDRNLAASELWGMIQASKAKAIIVIVDACHSGGFAFQSKLAQLAADAPNRVVITASSKAKLASGSKGGGKFTTDFLDALTSSGAVDPEVGAITLYRAFALAHSANISQLPKMEGGEALDKLVLAQGPTLRNGTVQSRGGRHEANTLGVDYEIVQSRQIAAKSSAIGPAIGDELGLVVKFFDPAERLSVRICMDGTNKAIVEYFANAKDQGQVRWERWDTVFVKIPLQKLKGRGQGNYRLELRPCDEGGKCGPPTRIVFAY